MNACGERVQRVCRTRLQDVPDAWVAGDCAAVPDLTQPGEFTGPSVQHAVRQARRLADQVILITGSTAGLGAAMAEALLATEAHSA